MRFAKPLLRHLCLALGCGLALLAVVPDVPAPAKASKAGAPALAVQATPDPCVSQPGAPPLPPRKCGRWGPLVNLKTVPVHISLLPDGRLLYWGRDKAADHDPAGDHWDTGGRSWTYTWHPSDLTGAGLTIKNNTTNLFCSAHSFLPDGRLLVTGGHSRYDPLPYFEAIGEDDVNVFDYYANAWSLLTNASTGLTTRLPKGRWYPSNVTLASGETVVVSGTYWDGTTTQTMPDGRVVPVLVHNESPDVITPDGQLRSFTVGQATPFYPYLHLNASGIVYLAGPSVSKFIDPFADGGSFTTGSSTVRDHWNGTAVTFDAEAGKVLKVGGFHSSTGVPVTNATIITPSNPSSTWQAAAPLTFKRKFHSAVLLPDGKVLVTGGTQCGGDNKIDCAEGAATRPELWDPNVSDPVTGAQTGRWTPLGANPSGIPRVYHSVGLLLPDGRVLVGGGGLPAAEGETVNGTTCQNVEPRFNVPGCLRFGHKDVEFFSPPYLFNDDGSEVSPLNGTRPVITSAPASVFYGQTFNVETSSALQTSDVVLVRLPSVTHGFTFDQRRAVLDFTATSSTKLSVTAPADGRVCPPGHYMLFVLNASLVPSVATIIKVEAGAQPPSAPTGLNAVAAAPPHVALTWEASTGNVSHYVVERAPTLGGTFSTVGDNVAGTSFNDASALSGVTYIYRVRAVGPSGAASDFSDIDIATTVLFTDHPLFPGVLFKAEHMSQLRQAVSAVRAAAELPPANWTDPNLSTATFVKAAHIQELRTNLDEALRKLGLPVEPYNDPVLAPDFTLIRADHRQEIRERVQ